MATEAVESLSSSRSTTTISPGRRPYTGSCHCGHTKYITYLTLPPPIISANPPSPSSTIRIRKCNCSTCQKMSYFHVRLMDEPNDFLLLSPLNPTEGGLSDYTCFKRAIHWYFCSKCGVRCFAFAGEGVVREVEVEGEVQKVWTPDPEKWGKGKVAYLSVNAATLDNNQEGLDLTEWTEKGWISYIDWKNNADEARMGNPHEGGMY
ncbi:hypothetical protein VE02_08158 [Pseudogymnoascus sp. 03VT05]|nr:hypothetical protein VE02_08158 [Pseudogymnoascus sp. 03VT05]